MNLRDELKAIIKEAFAEALAESGSTPSTPAPTEAKPEPNAEEKPKAKGGKRKRRTKAEIEADEKAKAEAEAGSDHGDELDDAEDMDYETFMTEVKKAIAKQGTAGARDAAVDHLQNEYGVEKFKDLDPKHFAECLSGIQDAVANA